MPCESSEGPDRPAHPHNPILLNSKSNLAVVNLIWPSAVQCLNSQLG